jgi:hypothetical protein
MNNEKCDAIDNKRSIRPNAHRSFLLSITQQKGEETVIKHKQLRRRPINKWKGRLTSEEGKGRQQPKRERATAAKYGKGNKRAKSAAEAGANGCISLMQ